VVGACASGTDDSDAADTEPGWWTAAATSERPADTGAPDDQGGDPESGATDGSGSDSDDESDNESTTSVATRSAPLTPETCAGLSAASGASVSGPYLSETSGVVASLNHPGVLWAHNDSGSSPIVVATDLAGNDLGAFLLPLESSVDIEGIGLLDGFLYLADIGDNDQRRTEIAVYRFAEPEPGGSNGVAQVETIRLRYPDGPHDAEAFLVDPASGQLVIVDKTFTIGTDLSLGPLAAAPATVWVASPPFGPQMELQRAGTVPLDQLDKVTTAPTVEGLVGQLGIGGLATAVDIRPDGAMIALRTYRTVWLFERGPGQSIAEALIGEPCEAPTIVEEQGEAIAFVDGATRQFVTIAEGIHPTINITTEQG
jgi:hypothetical protein